VPAVLRNSVRVIIKIPEVFGVLFVAATRFPLACLYDTRNRNPRARCDGHGVMASAARFDAPPVVSGLLAASPPPQLALLELSPVCINCIHARD
jgi:hypothetical protein